MNDDDNDEGRGFLGGFQGEGVDGVVWAGGVVVGDGDRDSAGESVRQVRVKMQRKSAGLSAWASAGGGEGRAGVGKSSSLGSGASFCDCGS